MLCRLTQRSKEVVSPSLWSCLLSLSLDLPKEWGRCKSQLDRAALSESFPNDSQICL